VYVLLFTIFLPFTLLYYAIKCCCKQCKKNEAKKQEMAANRAYNMGTAQNIFVPTEQPQYNRRR
jgi:hypothetical protein